MSELFGNDPRPRGHDQQLSGDGTTHGDEHTNGQRGSSVAGEHGQQLAQDEFFEQVGHEPGYDENAYVDENAYTDENVYVGEDGVEYVEEPVHALAPAPAPRRRRGLGVLVLLVCLALVGGAAFFGFDQLRKVAGGLGGGGGDYPGPGSGEVKVVIAEGASGVAIGSTLEDAGVVKSSEAFVDAVNASSGAQVQPGTYTLKKEMSAEGALALLQNPESKINLTVRVREGLWKSEVYSVLTKETGFTTEQLDAAAKDPKVGLPAEAGGDPEGYLFPATYTFDPDATPVDVLKAMVDKYREEMTKAQVPPEKQRRVLVLASLVQAEASRPEDFPKVARVIENRLVKQPKVPLGFDTTVNFAVKKRGFALTKTDLDSSSPYNTRKVAGLPPGPIDSPGAAAIEAAAKPSDGDFLYFVTTNPDTGETLFTSDYNAFLQGKEQFNDWYAKNKDSAGSDSGQPAQSESGQSDSGQSDSGQSDTGQSGSSATPDSTEQDATEPDTGN